MSRDLPTTAVGSGACVLMPASSDDRLAKIAEFHCKNVDAAGGTDGDCNECGWLWPCPTHQWATAEHDSVSVLCTWALRDCEFEEHDHSTASPDSQPGGNS